MAYEHIRLEICPGGVATLTLARPDRLNALSAQTVDELRVQSSSSRRTTLVPGTTSKTGFSQRRPSQSAPADFDVKGVDAKNLVWRYDLARMYVTDVHAYDGTVLFTGIAGSQPLRRRDDDVLEARYFL